MSKLMSELPWVVQKGSWFYVRIPDTDTYSRAVSRGELPNAVSNDLKGHVVLPLTKAGALQVDAFICTQGRLATSVAASYMNIDSRFDTLTGVMNVHTLQRATLEPEFDAKVDRYLRALGGKEDYGKLEQWLAGLSALDRPSPLLMVHGPKDMAKTMLGAALSRLWQGKTAKAEALTEGFNGELSRTPMIFCDEGFPDVNMSKLRDLITSRGRLLNEKFQPKYDIHGHIRIYVASNDNKLAQYSKAGSMGSLDIDAIGDRLLVIDVAKNPERYRQCVEALPQDPKDYWHQDAVAKHVLKLAEKVKLHTGRMCAESNGGDLAFERGTQAHAERLLCILERSNKAHAEVRGAAFRKDGVLWITAARPTSSYDKIDLVPAFDFLKAGKSATFGQTKYRPLDSVAQGRLEKCREILDAD